jgi:serine/threonine protein kinase
MATYPTLNTFQRLASAQADQPANATLGRFELRRMIGQGGQATVWLAFDPRLEREVALKVMRPDQGADAQAVAQWLTEARSVSRLTHPNIIPVFEADVQDQQPYLVFEYVPGQTLAAVLKQRGALPPREAVALMIDVLEALVAAHGAGVVHRDLKPSNVLVDATGRARVMDFGIAARLQDRAGAAPEASGGTPGYISPEAARGAAAAATMDVFSAAVVLAEMLSGKPLVDERDAYRAMQQVMQEQLELPADLGADVDDALRAIVRRGLMRDPAQRFPEARLFLEELRRWLKPVGTGPVGSEDKGGGTLEFLLRRMRHKSDFPALSGSIVRIQSISSSDKESVASLTNEILKDVALTNKLLRLVNTAHYSRGGAISTVSRAVTLVGFNSIRSMALSLVLLEHMQDKAHANLLKEEFLRSLMAGSIARELCPNLQESEEAFIGAMFQNLGRLLTEYYFPEEARAVRALTGGKEAVSESTAATTVLGMSYEALGAGIAKAWHLPDSIQRCIRKPVGAPPASKPADASERIRWTAMAANEMADVLLRSEPKDSAVQLAKIGQRYVRSLGLSAREIEAATAQAREKLADLARAMDIRVTPGSAAAKLLAPPPGHEKEAQTILTGTQDAVASHELHATMPITASSAKAPVRDAQHVAEMLAAGIQDITNAMVEDFKLADVLRMILETMLRAMEFQHIVFCMRDPKTEILTGRFGLGQGVERIVKTFQIDLKAQTPDLFSVVCTKGADTMISDASEPRIATRLPAWYTKAIHAPTFLLLPLTIKGAPFGLIYADKAMPGELQLGEKELAMLRTLRNQAVMAFRQSS